MLIIWVLLLQLVLACSTTGQQNVLAQVGASVTLTKGKFSETENVYVRWYYSATWPKENYVLLIWRKHNDSPKTENTDWQNRVSLSEDSALTISRTQETDFAGVFKCEQSNFRGSTEAFYRLIDVQMPLSLLLLVGEELSLKCITQTDIKWTAPNGSTYTNRQSRKDILRVPNTSVQDSGVWVCETPSKFKATTAVTILGLSHPPSETVYTFTSLSTSTTLPCSLSADVPWPHLRNKGLQGGSWSFTPLNKSNQQDHSLLTLELNTTQAWRAHNTTSCLTGKVLKNNDLSVQSLASTACRGTYQCSLEFRSRRPLSRTVKLVVLEVLSSAPVGVTLLEGDPVNLKCSLGVPLPSDLQVKWTPPKSSAFSLSEPHRAPLFLPAVSVKDSGQWKCELRNNSKVLTSASVTLKIEKLVDTWVFVTIGCASIFILLLIIILIIIIRRRRQAIITRRKVRFCCSKKPQPKGFYKS